MGIRQYPRESHEFLPVPIDGPSEDLTTLDVFMQVRLYPERPTSDGWKEAEWGEDPDTGQTVAMIPIGPESDFDFSDAPGTYIPYVRVIASPERPVVEGRPVMIT